KPWKLCSEVAGIRASQCRSQTMDEYHQACVRMIRADYCGDGVANTIDGNSIIAYDPFLLNKDDKSSYPDYWWTFDAYWLPSGAACVSADIYNLNGSKISYRKVPSCAATLTQCTDWDPGPNILYWPPP